MWPDNERALALFQQVGTRWMWPAMGGVPYGVRWEAVYPLMDRLQLEEDQWQALHADLMVLERGAIATMREFAPKDKR